MQRKIIACFLLSICLIVSILDSAITASAIVTYSVRSMDAISVSGNPMTLTINSGVAGNNPTNAVDSSTSYAVSTNSASRKITGSLASNMPSGVTLSIHLAAPTGGTSSGAVVQGTTATNLVTGIAKIGASGLSMTYTISASVNAAPVTNATNTVTYTIGP